MNLIVDLPTVASSLDAPYPCPDRSAWLFQGESVEKLEAADTRHLPGGQQLSPGVPISRELPNNVLYNTSLLEKVILPAKDYYEVLGVSRDADLKQIKQAFKKKALKLHPDVNKAPDAKERFMECKVAYQALSDAKERMRYDRSRGTGGGEGNFSWEDVVSSGARSRKAAEEAFYGLGDFFRDLDRDRVERRRSRGRPEQPMSLWEELTDIGEEFVEFLEKEIGLSAPRDVAGSRSSYETEASTEEARRQVREAEERARRAAATAEDGARKVNDDIEEMLQKMKRDLGVK